MMFSDTTNKNGLIQKCEFNLFGSDYGAISGNTTRLAEFTTLINEAFDSVVSDILDSDTRWQWDDTNRTDFPIGVVNLVAGQIDYSLDVSHLKILGVEVLDASGNYYPLLPIDARDMVDQGMSPTEFLETNGQPQYYDLIGNSIMLYPQPDSTSVTLTNGLKVRFQRGATQFVVTDTEKEPGFASLYHKLLHLIASYDYAVANQMMEKANFLNGKIEQERNKLKRFMTKRDKGERPRISMRIKRAN